VSDRTRPRFAEETPIERIFKKVIGRKMTESERLAFRLKPVKSIPINKELIKKDHPLTANAKAARAGG
jgi:hypothetical protein